MLSLRDPDGFVSGTDDKHVYRFLKSEFAQSLLKSLQTESVRVLVAEGCLIDTVETEGNPLFGEIPQRFVGEPCTLVQHRKLPFINYPEEWHPLMLCAAASQTLRIAQRLANNKLSLKDATPYNLIFENCNPVWVDVPSIQERDTTSPLWLAESQFAQTFVLPGLADRYFGTTPKQIFLGSPNGLEPKSFAGRLGLRHRLSMLNWNYIYLPNLLSEYAQNRNSGDSKATGNPMSADKAEFIYKATLARNARHIKKLPRFQRVDSTWAQYTGSRGHYSSEELARKKSFIAQFMKRYQPRDVLDVGANTGEFSLLAADSGARVVATDLDPDAIGKLFQIGREKKLQILPLVIDMSNPTPASGWAGRERLSFLDRAENHFDVVLMLAVVHHLLISGGIPLDEQMKVFSRMTKRFLIVEHVPPDDDMVLKICANREHNLVWLSQDQFRQTIERHFSINHIEEIQKGGRSIYLLEKLQPQHAQ